MESSASRHPGQIEAEGLAMLDEVAGRPLAERTAVETGRGVLRVLACGGGGGGKTTLVSRLPQDARPVDGDQPAALIEDGRVLAVHSFAARDRGFTVADVPGDESCARHMAAAASACDLTLLVVDARNGLTTQDRRHACWAALLGIGSVVLAVNKMDLVDFSRERFEALAAEFAAFGRALGLESVEAVPVSALTGDNVAAPSPRLSWYRGPTLMVQLEAAETRDRHRTRPFRLPVQSVVGGHGRGRGYAGTVAAGSVRAGEEVAAWPSGQRARVVRILVRDGERTAAQAGDAVTVSLDRDIELGAGDMLAQVDAPPAMSDQIAAHVIWTAEEPMLAHRGYVLKLCGQTATATVTALKHKVNVNTLEHQAGRTLGLNEAGFCNISLDRPLVFDPHRDGGDTGGFILVDRFTDVVLGRGLIAFGLRRATNIQWQALQVDKATRSGLKGQRPCALWFTGLSGAGKSTVASLLEKKLAERGRHTYVLDGDNVRHGLNKDLGFTDADRVENIRRVAETAKLFVDAGLIVIVSFISPFRSERRMARELFEAGEFIEVFVDTPLEVCEARDPKGLYRKARAGQIKNFTGIDSAYEAPERAEVRLDGARSTPEALAEALVAELERRRLI